MNALALAIVVSSLTPDSAVTQLPLSTDRVLQMLALADQLMIEPALKTCTNFLETDVEKSPVSSAKLCALENLLA